MLESRGKEFKSLCSSLCMGQATIIDQVSIKFALKWIASRVG